MRGWPRTQPSTKANREAAQEIGRHPTDAEFGSKAADVVALYLNPPENAVVVCVDEKPHIQASQRAQGYLRLPDGRAINGFSHC